MVGRLLGILPLLVLSGCLTGPAGQSPLALRDAEITRDTVWQGRVVVDGAVTVRKGATLTLLPGTEVAFLPGDNDGDGLGDGTLVIEGGLVAEGTPERPIRFRSAAERPAPGDWLEIRIDFCRDLRLRYCEITDSAHGLHVHFSRGVIEDSVLRNNIDGFRVGESTLSVRRCLIEENPGKGINFRNAEMEIRGNILRGNGTGIFLFETDRPFTVTENNLYRNGFNFRLGDFFTGDVELAGNWWGTPAPGEAAATVYDRSRDPVVGTVSLVPAPHWIRETGPRQAVEISVAWSLATEGFVDASPLVAGGRIFLPSWDGKVYALDPAGRLLWSTAVGDVMDAPLAAADGLLVGQSWSREVFALERDEGRPAWRTPYGASPADDHRQGGLLVLDDLVLVPAWNGELLALDAADGSLRWRAGAGYPLRSAPVWDGERILVAGGDGRLAAFHPQGGLLWRTEGGEGILAPPAVTATGPVVVDRSGLVRAFDRRGRERWRRSLGEPCRYAAPQPADDGLLIGTAAGSLWKLDPATGETLWRVETGAALYAAPLVSSGRLFVGNTCGLLLALDAVSGEILASVNLPEALQGTPALAGGRLVIGCRDGRVYGLDLLPSPDLPPGP